MDFKGTVMFLIAAFSLSFCGLAACSDASHAGVSSEGSVWNTDLIETLVRRVDMLEARDLQHQQQMAAVQKKLKRQDQEILTLRMLLSNRNKEPIQDREKESVDIEEKSEESTADIQIRSMKQVRKEQIIRRAQADTRVAFFATLGGDVHHLGKNQNVAFENVVTNQGSAYNPHAGLFVAPVPGTYVFSTDVTTLNRNSTHLGFALNGKFITVIWVDGAENAFDSSSQTIVLQLQQGDDVSVKHMDSDKSITGASHSLFCGFLLYQTSDDVGIVG